MDPGRKKSLHAVIPALTLVILTLLAYSNSFNCGFVLDNRGLILHDPRLHEPAAASLAQILTHTYWWPNGESGLYRPFTTISYLFNYAILGNRENPAGYHAINLLLHAANVLLVFALAKRFLRTLWPPFFIAGLWAVHPVLTESVTNIVGRADLLAATGVLGGLLLYLKSREATGIPRALWLAALATLTAIAVFSKESAAIIPGVILLYELTFHTRSRPGRAQLLGFAATVIPVGVMLAARASVLSGTLPMEIPFTDNPIAFADFVTGRLTALDVLARDILLLAWPANLSADYSWSEIKLATGSPFDEIVAILVIAILPALVFLWRNSRPAFFFALTGLAWLIPASNLLFPIGTIMAERFLYLAALGFIACLVPVFFAVVGRRLAIALLSLALVAFGARTWFRNADWKDDMSIASASVRTAPQSFKTHDLLANVLFESDPSHGNLDRVIAESEASRAVLDPLPNDRTPPDPYRFAANCYMIRGSYPKAITALQKLIVVEAAQLATFKARVGPGRESALENIERATRQRQADAELLLSTAYRLAGDLGHATEAMQQAGGGDLFNPELYRLKAETAAAAGRLDDAAVALVEGAFVTSDKSLRQGLVDLYQRGLDPSSCALTQGPNGPAINPACAIVHRHVCAASAYTVKTLAAAGRTDVARERKTMFLRQFACPAAPLDEALP